MSDAPLDAASPGPAETPAGQDPAREGRKARRVRIRQAFGTRLLTTFAATLTVVTALVFLAAGVLVHDTAYRSLDLELGQHLEDVAALTASNLEGSPELPALLAGAGGAGETGEVFRARLDRILGDQLGRAGISGAALFRWPPGGEPQLLASTRGADEDAQVLGRLLADTVAIERTLAQGEATASSLYPDPHPDAEGRSRLLKSGFARLELVDKSPILVAVDLPAGFTDAVEEVAWRFMILGALAGATVLATAVLLVRQRVHIPIYRLVRAMRGPDGQPQRARVRWPDEIGVLTRQYNRMVDRLGEKDRQLRELYARTRERASYLQGYSNTLVAGVPSGVVAVDARGAITVWNPAAARILGREARLGTPVAEELGADHLLGRALLGALSGSLTAQALMVLGEPGDGDQPLEGQRLVEVSCAPFHGEDGELQGAAALLTDRTELEQLRRAASRNERLAAIGNLGAGLAHEIKNPLGAISGFAELIERKEGAEAARLAARLRAEVEALDRFLKAFLAFAREDRIRREPCALAEVVRSGVEVGLTGAGLDPATASLALEGQAVAIPEGGSLSVGLQLDAPLPLLALDSSLVRSACANLAKNACQAMAPRGGGRLEVRLSRAGQTVFLRFRDSGPGVRPEDRERIFDPLFTTRAEGTGLGLAISHKAIVAHGGEITVRDAPQGGAEFLIRLPLVAAGPDADLHGDEAPASASALGAVEGA